MSIKAATKYVGGLALAAALLWWVLRGSDPAALWSQLRRASLAGLLLCALFNTGHIIFRVWRWRALLEPGGRQLLYPGARRGREPIRWQGRRVVLGCERPLGGHERPGLVVTHG